MMRVQDLAHTLARETDRPLRSAADGDLLARFLDYHDEIAFEELVSRHLPAVRAVCRSVLRDPNDADDALQATFLVLVRRAGSIRDRLALGAWLCRVAWRTSNRLRLANDERNARFAANLDPYSTPARAGPEVHADQGSIVDDEIRRLPEQYRLAVLLCYRAGLSTAEAATRLGWPKGTLLTRLAWARKRLRDRLAKRGVSVAGCLTLFVSECRSGAAEAMLVCRCVAVAMKLAAGGSAAAELVSERVSTLTEGMVRAMFATKMKLTLGIAILMAALLGLGVGRMTIGEAEAAPNDNKKAAVPAQKTAGAESGSGSRTAEVASEAEASKAEAANLVSGNELVIRRPLGSYTREVAGFGKATATFTENRIHVNASVRIEKASFNILIDADYSMNRESVVYGVITSVDFNGPLGEEESVEMTALLAAASDLPFSFRIRVDDDAMVVKDIKCGPFGSPIFAELTGGGDGAKDALLISGIICGKYKADPNPEKTPAIPPAKPKRK